MRFVLPLPPSTNNLFVNVPGVGRRKSAAYKAWLKEAGGAILPQRAKQRMPDNPPYMIDVWLFFGDARQRDHDNYVKAVQDFLASTFGFNDKLVTDGCQHKRIDRENPRCVVYLKGSDE